MKRFVLVAGFTALFAVNTFAHEAFALVSSEKKTVTEADILQLEKQRTIGKKDGTNLVFEKPEITLLVITGPEDDMLSYRIQGMRNPTIVTPSNARITVWFVNKDGDMHHDIRFAHIMGDFVIAPDLAETVGTERLGPHEDDKAPMEAEKIVITSNEDGAYKYFCSVKGHAKGGMWGNILVGVKPTPDLKLPTKYDHGEKMDNMPGMMPSPSPTPQGGSIMDKMPAMPGMKPTASPTPNKPSVTDCEHGGCEPADAKRISDLPIMHHGDHDMQMSSVTNIADPMERESSGTSWNPDSSPVYAKMVMSKSGGMWMFMGSAFLRYTNVGSTRNVSVAGKGSDQKADAPSMFMAMYSHPVGKKAQIGFRGMFSLDPLIEQGFGYPLLYQTGEQYKGVAIHDRQHPHDLFSELAFTYSYKFDEKRSFYFYAGYPGEPALGPPTFMHRLSASNIPDAPIGHHWQDATHITFGVVTAGLSFGKVKIEASAFNGREPDDKRWNFDKPRLNSFSGRVSWNPTKNWALQISHGYLRDPEPAEPDVHILRRTTASAIYNRPFGGDRNLATSFVFGQNDANGQRSNSVLAEANFDFFGNAVFGRFERVQKSGHDLVLGVPLLNDQLFWVGSASVGYLRELVRGKGLDVGLGAMLTFNTNPTTLAPFYGGTGHTGFQIFLRVRPSKLGH